MSCPHCGAVPPVPPGGGAGEGTAGPPGGIPGADPAADPGVVIPVTCQVHGGPARLVIRRKDGRMVLEVDGRECCVLTLGNPAVTRLFDALGEWLG
jgi:hypothetical protein